MDMKKIRALGALSIAALWLGLAAFAWFRTPGETSEAERRKLAQMPPITTESVLDGKFMSDFDSYTLDQFPLRDSFRKLKALFSYNVLRQADNNGIYIAQGYAAKLEYPLNVASAQGAAEKFQKLYDLYLKGTCDNIVFCVIPDKSYYLAEENGYLSMDYEQLFSTMDKLDWAEHVDITDCLTIQDYYFTDTHWRQERILDAARKLSTALGVAGPKAENFTVTALERPFYGVYYGQAALPMEPETVYLMESDLLSKCTVMNYETGKTTSVYDLEKLESRDLYDVFLSGAAALLTIDNPNSATDRELIVFRDSFGSSLVPLLIQDYARVTLIDTRYVATDYLGQLVDFHGQDVLFLYSTLVLNNSAMLK